MRTEHMVNRPHGSVVEDVWCITCQHTHIPSIPAVTFRCADCGFGSWEDWIAESHATDLPDHIVFPQHHQTVPIEER